MYVQSSNEDKAYNHSRAGLLMPSTWLHPSRAWHWLAKKVMAILKFRHCCMASHLLARCSNSQSGSAKPHILSCQLVALATTDAAAEPAAEPIVCCALQGTSEWCCTLSRTMTTNACPQGDTWVTASTAVVDGPVTYLQCDESGCGIVAATSASTIW